MTEVEVIEKVEIVILVDYYHSYRIVFRKVKIIVLRN